MYTSRNHLLHFLRPTRNSAPSVFTTMHSMFEESMLGLRQKETSSVSLLVVFLLTIIKKLIKQFVNLIFHSDMEYAVMATARAGINPSCDTAIRIATDARPIFLYDYKPVVNPGREFVNIRCLLGGLIQGFYCLLFRKVKSMIQCLMDMHTWHFMKLNKHSNQIGIE